MPIGHRSYSVNSIFDAVHVLSTRAMPPNRPLGEYITILRLLAEIFSAMIINTKALHGPKPKAHLTSTSIGLLVCFTGLDNGLSSRAVIGFSAIGKSKRRQRTISNRRMALPQLARIGQGDLDWVPGNCAECETFACYKDMCVSLGGVGSGSRAVSLTLNIGQGGPVPFCRQCCQLAKIIARENGHGEIVDLA